jgi:hypothetical protein
MTPEEQIEFRDLKRIRAERGFWLPQEEQRYYELFDLHALDFKLKCKALDLIHKQMEQN